MATEIEKKYRLSRQQLTAVENVLERIGAEYAGADFEENILFLGDGFIEKGAVLRLRRIGEVTILTFKQKLIWAGGAKHHTEHETIVGNFDEMSAILENLGYRRSMIYEKRRRTWYFRKTEIVLDVLPFGDFMEIEGALRDIAEAESALGAEDFVAEHLTYPQIVLQHGKRNGNVIESRFGAEV